MDRTKLTQADMDDIREKKKDFYIHPKEALKWGIVDEIIQSQNKRFKDKILIRKDEKL